MTRLSIATSVSTIVLASIMFMGPGLVLAQNSPVSSASPSVEQRCQKITAKIGTMITNSQARLQKRQTEMTNRNSNVQKRIQELTSKGADTTKLSADAQQLITLQNQLVSDFQKYISLLQATQNFTCGDSQGKFKAALQAARDQLKVLRQDNQNIKTFGQQTLQPDFQTARQSTKGKKAKPSGSTNEATTRGGPIPVK